MDLDKPAGCLHYIVGGVVVAFFIALLIYAAVTIPF